MIRIFSAPLRNKGELMRYPGVCPRARGLAGDQNIQFLRLGQFHSNYKG